MTISKNSLSIDFETPKISKVTHYVIKTKHDDFNNFIKDSNIKQYIRGKISWSDKMLIILSYKIPNETVSYMMLKYSELIDSTSTIVPDLKPAMFKDYWPEADNKFTKYFYENYRSSKGK